jgi:exonuclease SbcD
MKILHTADWHLGDRLGRIDRTNDLQRAVERIGYYCTAEKIDVLLIAGDLFSELSRADGLRQSIRHFQEVFFDFLIGGGTIVALTGNHDNENFCQTLHHAMTLASPTLHRSGVVVPRGAFYLATHPTFFRLPDRTGQEVQFVLMPYPTPARYLDEQGQRYSNLAEKNQALQASYAEKLQAMLADPDWNATLPTILSAHIHVRGATLPNLFRISEAESMIFSTDNLPNNVAYMALGHIHQPQAIGAPHIRYSGSIERLDLGERNDRKGVVVFEVGPEGRRGDIQELQLEATPMYDVDITRPQEELPLLRERYPDADRALVRYHLKYRAGVDNLEELLRQLDDIFPRWYEREWREAGELGPALSEAGGLSPLKGVRETVREYLAVELADHEDREEITRLAEELLAEEDA